MLTSYQLRYIRHYLQQGGIIAYPTEAVYGLGCDPWNETAVEHLLQLKQRDWRKGLIIIAADFASLQPFILPLASSIETKLQTTWQQQVVTWLVPARPEVPACVRGNSTQIAVRVTRHPIAAALCRAFGGAVISTSANLSQHRPAKTACHVRQQFKGQTLHIVSGALGAHSRPSEIRDALTDVSIRL